VGFIIYLLLDKWEALTHGSLGIINIAPPEGFGLIDFTRTIPFYYLVLFFLVLAIVLVSRISSSLVGRTFLAIRISDDLAQSLGINLMRNKVLAFVLSTVYAGLAGGLYAVWCALSARRKPRWCTPSTSSPTCWWAVSAP